MSLSRGAVVGEQLVCPYHGWRYSADGQVTSPANPELRVKTGCYEAAVRYGVVFIRRAGGSSVFPKLDIDGLSPIAPSTRRVAAPMPLVLDNFVEVEHTPTTHALLGYDPERMAEVESRVEQGDDWVRVINEGPQKHLPAPVRWLLNIGADALFVDDWTTRFSPVWTQYDHWWRDRRTGERTGDLLRTAVFFNPVDDRTTDLWVLPFTSARRLGRRGLNLIVAPVVRRLIDYELTRDKTMIENLADHSTSLRGMKLGRFDKALGLNRKRIAAIYDA